MHDDEHLDCDCQWRLLRLIDRGTCPGCRRSFRPPGEYLEMPTQRLPGEALEIASSCPRCDDEITWRAEVVR